MTSLFFVMLVLYVLTYVRLNTTIKLQKEKLAIIETVEENLKPLKSDSTLFTYEEEFKRFKLSFDVKFEVDQFQISYSKLENYGTTVMKIDRAGAQLKSIIDNLKQAKEADPKLKNVSYILAIAGYASKTGEKYHNYELSYKRALSLRDYWHSKGIDFEAPEYKGLIDLQISGNGWGGVGRLEKEEDNQRFLIQIFPKIGDFK
ncbi:OmpA family protein [Pseudoflavitalea sp. X16]|uniref:OmpA family protein n=1 Tax=Paraflavitalea devenefica TaxID=2716334 RepID=UPI001420E10D|nr:OmpA family protein [Paraflavitalea devenefica]NII26673.1 OmpA family protein [Paraflavitalea devenefica]